MKIILTKPIWKWLQNEPEVSEDDIIQAALEIIEGNYEASLGGGLFKKRVALGQGKSGGVRLITGYKEGNNVYFMFAFKKSEKSNITTQEKDVLKARAKIYFNMTAQELAEAIRKNAFHEIKLKKK